MTRYMLRTGFSLVPAEGVGHLTDMPTGDVLVVPGADVPVLMTAATGGLDDTAPGAADVLARYRPFLVQALQSSRSFYELDIEDAPPLAPSISPVRSEAEDELRRALARSAAPAEEPAPPVAVPEVEPEPPQLSQEENLRRALEQARPPPTREEVAAYLAKDGSAERLFALRYWVAANFVARSRRPGTLSSQQVRDLAAGRRALLENLITRHAGPRLAGL